MVRANKRIPRGASLAKCWLSMCPRRNERLRLTALSGACADGESGPAVEQFLQRVQPLDKTYLISLRVKLSGLSTNLAFVR
jgi:hypothetical protein